MKHQTRIIATVTALAIAALSGFAQEIDPASGLPTAPAKPIPQRAQRAPVAPVAPTPPTPPKPAMVSNYELKYANAAARGGGSAGNTRTLVVPKDAGDAKSLSETEEDLNVMAHLLEKAATGRDDKARRYAMGIFADMAGPSSGPRTLYIEGHGALFFLNVNYPLIPPSAKAADAETKEADSEWEEARRELHNPGGANPFEIKFPSGFDGDGNPEPFDADKVDKLKSDLIAALKNAGHIRKLKSDETVAVIVSGRGSPGEPKVATRRSNSSGGGGGAGGGGAGGGGGSGQGTSVSSRSSSSDNRPAKLVLRARKSDIEAFQKDKTSLDDFRKKVTVFTY